MLLKRHCLTVIVLIALCSNVSAGALAHDWSQRFGDAFHQYGEGVAVDGLGNVVVIGDFDGTVDFGGGGLTSAGMPDIFVAKFDAAGNHLWSKIFGDADWQNSSSVAVDGAGAIVVTGGFRGTVHFGGGTLTSAGDFDIFVAKFDAAGNHLWSKRFGDVFSDYCAGVTVDGSGAVVVTGNFSGSVDFGGGVLTSAGGYDIFVAKFDAAGGHLWSQRFGDASGSQAGRSVSTDGAGAVVVTGNFYGSVDFGGGGLTSAGNEDIFLAKFDADGNHVWSKIFGDFEDEQQSNSVVFDKGGNVIITGHYLGGIDFGGGVLASVGGDDIFVAKFDADGNHLWSHQFGGVNGQYGTGVTVDGWSNIVVTGHFSGSVDFGGGVLTSLGGDLFVAKLDSTGNHLWSQGFGDGNSQAGRSVTVDGWGNVVVTGEFRESVDFGGGILTNAGGDDIFVAKFWRAAPEISDVWDVPGDQGGFVNVAWLGSGADTPVEHVITEYTIWRGVETPAAMAALSEGARLVTNSIAGKDASADGRRILREGTVAGAPLFWELMETVPAFYLSGYFKPIATQYDSTAVSPEPQYFQVIAHTSDPFTFYVSDPDTGYSLDNLAPGAPQSLAGSQAVAPDGLVLTWAPNAEADLENYAVYRGLSAGFTPGSGNLIAEQPDTTALDTEWSWNGGYYYKVSAIDIHGNESQYALLLPQDVTDAGDVPLPHETFLGSNYPNPFNPSTHITFGLKEASDVSLRVYDTAGRFVRAIVEGRHDARVYDAFWDGTDDNGRAVASGVYFFRLTVNDQTLTRKAVLLK